MSLRKFQARLHTHKMAALNMLRTLRETDFTEMLNIEDLTQDSPWNLETFARCWQAGYLGWVVEQNEIVIGYIISTLHTEESHILNLCVHPKYQHQGFGKLLLAHALMYVKEKGAKIAFLEVRRSNSNAISLYEKNGFVQISERKAYYPAAHGREDALVFARDLSDLSL